MDQYLKVWRSFEMQKAQYIPIVVPQKHYVDQRGLDNAYHENNLALHIENNHIIMLIRQVNYRKFHNQSFTVGESISKSHYCMLSGPGYDHLTFTDLIYDWNNFPSYNTYWLGMEDIRFINHDELLVTVPQCNSNGLPCLFLATLCNNKIVLKEKLSPSIQEKNWMPFDDQVVYSVCPLVIKDLRKDHRRLVCENDLKNYHGSTNGIKYKDQWLFLIHRYHQNKVEHRWMLFDEVTEKMKVSEPFVFFTHSFLEFNSSLCWYEGMIHASLAVNEDKIYVAVINPKDIPI